MKATTLIVLLFFTSTAFAQTATTDDEYNYVTKSYVDVLNKGIDIKSGYSTVDLFKGKDDTKRFSIDVKAFVKDTSVRSLIYVIYDKDGLADKILCAPNPGSSERIFKDYALQLLKLGTGKQEHLLTVLGLVSSRLYQLNLRLKNK